jgi:hypothetical protein
MATSEKKTQTPPAGRGAGAKERPSRGAAGLYLTVIFLGALAILYVSERMVLETNWLRYGLDAIGLGAILAAIALRAKRRSAAQGGARTVEGMILVGYLFGLLAVLLYAAQADRVMDLLRGHFENAKIAEHYSGALTALWPMVLLLAMAPTIFVEISYGPMDTKRTVELARIHRSAASGLVLTMTVGVCVLVNFVVSEFNKSVDLSYFKTTRASESSKNMVKNLSEPMTAYLFFPGANEALDEVLPFFEDLRRESKLLTVKVVDHALEPGLAKEYAVTDNGSVVLVRKKQHELLALGTKIARAKNKLRKLDAEFQTAFTKLSRGQKTAYFTVGHEERTQEERDGVKGSGIRDLRSILQELNYAVKDLGISQGLAQEIPDDATLVVIAGPRKDFQGAELEALRKYLEKGGRVMVFLDPEAGIDLAGLLGPFGLKYLPTALANDRSFVRATYTQADRHFLYSNRYSSHPCVGTLSRNSNQVATLFQGVGALQEMPPTISSPAGRPQVQFVIQSLAQTFNDANGNFVFDSPAEVRKVWDLASVVTLKLPKGAAKTTGKKDEREMRLLVVGDSDMLTDKLLRNPGNGYFFVDTLRWMGGEEEAMGETTSEEDVRIMHTRKEDQVWFYLTIFGVPSLVLIGGLVYSRRIRRRP